VSDINESKDQEQPEKSEKDAPQSWQNFLAMTRRLVSLSKDQVEEVKKKVPPPAEEKPPQKTRKGTE